MKRTTIKDLAKLLQVSTSTISRALSDHQDISDAVKQKVKEAAELLNYHPSDFAINFRNNSTKVIGLIIPKLSMFFIPSILEGISGKLKKEGYNFFILSSEENLEIEKQNLLTCSNSRVDGILISLTTETETLEHFKLIQELQIPVVIFDKSIEQSGFDEVIFDNADSSERCAKKLIDANCKNILAVFGAESLDITEKRKVSFLNTITQNKNIACEIVFANSSEMAKEKVEFFLENKTFDGIFAMSDEVLAGVNIALINKNIDKNKIKVQAISGGILPKYLNSSYEFEKNDGLKMGLKATEILLEKIKNKNKISVPQKYYI